MTTRRACTGSAALRRLMIWLGSAVSRFPNQTTVFYHLTVYGCHLRRLRDAMKWLERAFEIGDATQIKLKALDDPDLEPLWVEIGEI